MRSAADIVAAAKAAQTGKALIAPGGWAFLVNDTNDFLAWQFGVRSWDAAERERVRAMMDERIRRLSPTPYLMVITPEKSVPYQHWLPHGLADLPCATDRPAAWLAAQFPGTCHYPAERLMELQRHGLNYFRGDTHVNGLGAYQLYVEAIGAARALGCDLGEPLAFGQLRPQPIGFEGDLYVQIDADQKAAFDSAPDSGRWNDMLEVALAFQIRPGRARAHRVEPPQQELPGVEARELTVHRHEDTSLPRALVFRDSTATHLIDYLAEHFSRMVTVWHHRDVAADLIAREQPDIVLHFVAERFLATAPSLPALHP